MSSFTPILLPYIFLVMPLFYGGTLAGKKIKCLNGIYHLQGGVYLKDYQPDEDGEPLCDKCGMRTCTNSSGYSYGKADCHDLVCEEDDCDEEDEYHCVDGGCDTDKCNDPDKLYTTTTTSTTTMETTTGDQESGSTGEEEQSTKDKGKGEGGSTNKNKGEGSTTEKPNTGDNGETDETTPEGDGNTGNGGAGGSMVPEGILIWITIVGGSMGMQIVGMGL